MQATIFNLQGQALDTVELNDAIYGIEPNIGVVHQAVLRQQANARLGTHNTLTRADVRGGGRKPWRQKGTGRARQGSTRAPQWRHGGVVFGPHPRSYVQDLPRKMRRLAMRSVLSAKAADGQILVIDSFTDLEPRTKVMLSTLAALNLADRRVLIMTPERHDNLELAAGNLKNVTTMRTQYLSLVAMLKAEILVLDRASLTVIESILGQTGGRTSRPIAAPEGAAPSRLASVLDGEPAAPAAEAPAVGGATVTSTITAAPPPATSPVESPVETEADTAAADTAALETQGEEENA
ncbi:MAG TPA: 50S ribosomal protein L4 [Chloroflexia bacterium]|nr:50S ribosomal protein L4 [Chloroflexia bacterium]